MNNIKLYGITDQYIDFLRSDAKLRHVFDNKECDRTHLRKYLGAVFEANGFSYYIPLSSPKSSDYFIDKDGNKVIRRSIPSIIRITVRKKSADKLIGTLKISNMIPVPKSELIPYDISSETDIYYKKIVTDEMIFIRKNAQKILDSANLVYTQKCREDNKRSTDNADNFPKYLDSVLPFQYAEEKCMEYQKCAVL